VNLIVTGISNALIRQAVGGVKTGTSRLLLTDGSGAGPTTINFWRDGKRSAGLDSIYENALFSLATLIAIAAVAVAAPDAAPFINKQIKELENRSAAIWPPAH